VTRKKYRTAKIDTKIRHLGGATYECEEGQVDLSRFSPTQRKAIAKARKKAESLHGGHYFSLYFNGFFPRKDNCHRNAQIMAAYSGLPLTYHEGWTLYRYENGDVGFCYHSWNETQEGELFDTTWDFDFFKLTDWKLSSRPMRTRALLTQRDYKAQHSQLSAETIPLFMNYHSDSFLNRMGELLELGEVEDWLAPARAAPMFAEVPDERFELLARELVGSSASHFRHTGEMKAEILNMMNEKGIVKIQPFISKRLAIESGAVVL
jgi:hypothetical protein